ncbi:hypothetical protein GCM10023310_01790 [Paenibacillus vulneris]|uniref:UDP-N-acetylglucosamine 2-epimerase n=1 Tax=Paenibacillus vulneris TaxID=1133364 RepID=A0ABW3UFV3_9BACL
MKKIVVFTYLERHLKKLIPLLIRLIDDKNIKLSLVLMTKEEENLARYHNIPYIMLDEFTNLPRRQNFDISWGLEPLINCLKLVEPDLFIAIEVNYILRNAIRYCKQNNIPNMIIQHGTPNDYSLHAFAPFEGETFAAWGEFTKRYLIQNGVPENKIIVTGGMNFDRTLNIKTNKKQVAPLLGIDENKKWVLFTTQGVGAGGRPTKNEIISGVQAVTRRAKDFDDVQLIFQVHPDQQIIDIQQHVNEISESTAIVCKYKNTEELIAVSDAVITFFSTTAIDAVILEKPLMLINLVDQKDFFPFVRMKAAFGVYCVEQIWSDFSNLLDSNCLDQRDAANFMNYLNDGNALERILSLCYEKLGVDRVE